MIERKVRKVYFRKGFLLIVILFNFLFMLNFVSCANVGLSPAKMNFENVMRNGYSEKTAVISADTDYPINLELSARGEIAEWLNFTKKNITVSKDKPYYLKISVTPPSDIPNGNYSGFLRVLTSSLDGESGEGVVGKIISSLDLAIKVQVTDIEEVSCSAKDFDILSVEEGDDIILKMNVLNSGNVRLKPTVLVEIWDQDQIEILKTEELIANEILPTLDGNIEFRLDSKGLDLGQYWSSVSVLECYSNELLTFDILKEGALTVKGELLGILTPGKMNVGDTTTIIVNFKNQGEKEVEAQFKGKISLGGRIVQILESEKLNIGINEVDKFNFYFTPQKAGQYVISGRVYYSGKKTFESSAILEAISDKNFISKLFLPFIYICFILVISILFYKIRKERKIYLNKLRGLRDGIYRYYVKCIDESIGFIGNETELSIILRINSLVNAQIIFSKEEPLSEGIVEISLITSKIVSFAPTLSYSMDGGLVKTPIPLLGNEKFWKGYLSIDKNFGEGVISFDFKANDLEGRQGTKIISGGVVKVDTLNPSTILEIVAVGYDGEIKLDWHYNGDYKEFNIYRSLSANPDFTDFYKISGSNSFNDKWVEDGKTYYYRVSVIDDAGNEGELSSQVYATSLLNNVTYVSGLALELMGRVDNLLVEIDFAVEELMAIKNSIATKSQKEKDLFSNLKLENEIDKSKSDLISLKQDVEKYKLQDLTENELNSKIASSRVKMNVIGKKVPEDIIILQEDSMKNLFDEKSIEEFLFESDPLMSKERIDKSVKESLKIIDESGLEMASNFYLVEILYSDGTSKKISVVERNINSIIDRQDNQSFIEVFPRDIIDSINDIAFRNSNVNTIKEDSVISFESDSKNIFYSFESNLDTERLREIKVGFISIADEEIHSSFSLTGYFLLDLDRTKYAGGFAIILLLAVLFVYLFYNKKSNFSNEYFQILDQIKKINRLFNEEDLKFAKDIYSNVSKKYALLDSKEKAVLYKDLENLHEKISVFDFELGLDELIRTKDIKLISKLDKIYQTLSLQHRNKVSKVFEKVKDDLKLNSGAKK